MKYHSLNQKICFHQIAKARIYNNPPDKKLNGLLVQFPQKVRDLFMPTTLKHNLQMQLMVCFTEMISLF